ncbi:MAG: 50S ribosomal protein L4 [Fimbriimonadaceae bacterium]
MAELAIKNEKGKEVGKHKLSDSIAAAKASRSLLHRAVVSEESNSRQGTQETKTRSEARGGGRKPYRQKKTGNARQGSIRAPHYARGGMAHALKPRDYSKKLNRKERRAALKSALNLRAEAGDLILVDKLQISEPKTKEAVAFLQAQELAEVKRVLIIVAEHDVNVHKSFRNLGNVVVKTAPNAEGKGESFSARDLLVAHKIVATKDAMAKIEEVWS